jgi:hypothetical protein
LEHVAIFKGSWNEEEPIFGASPFVVHDRRYLWLEALRLWRPAAQAMEKIEKAGKG